MGIRLRGVMFLIASLSVNTSKKIYTNQTESGVKLSLVFATDSYFNNHYDKKKYSFGWPSLELC